MALVGDNVEQMPPSKLMLLRIHIRSRLVVNWRTLPVWLALSHVVRHFQLYHSVITCLSHFWLPLVLPPVLLAAFQPRLINRCKVPVRGTCSNRTNFRSPPTPSLRVGAFWRSTYTTRQKYGTDSPSIATLILNITTPPKKF